MKPARLYYSVKYSFIWRKPRLVLRLVTSLLGVVVRGKRPLRYIDVNVGLDCNLHCAHCFAENFRLKDGRPLSDEEWRDVISQCRDLGATAIGFTGGEPLAYPRLFDLIRHAEPDRMLIAVVTNGTLLTRDMARRLKDAGVDVVQMSLDSGIGEEHDQFRGLRGSFRETMQAFDNARRVGLRAAVVPTVSHNNIHSKGLQRLISWAKENRLLVNLSLAAPVGEWGGNTDCLLTEEDFRSLSELLMENGHVRRDFESNYWSKGCGAAIEKIYITCYGDVIPCPFMHISFGNVREHSIAEIRQKMLANQYLGRFHTKCLTAEDRGFMDRFLPKRVVRGQPLPTSEQVFGP